MSQNMTTSDDSSQAALERFPTGIPGLDEILKGGFFRSGVYMIAGTPGSGKTILANQICYNHVAAGGSAVYVTLLAESHSRMLQHMRQFSFFDESAIPKQLSYVSAFSQLESDGLKGLMELLRREMRARRASLLVLDGLVAASEAAQSDKELKKFIHELQTSAVFHGCTVFLLTSGGVQRVSAEHTMVDGLLELQEQLFEARSERHVNVRKFRGGDSLRGKQSFRIDPQGLRFFPRIELVAGQRPQAAHREHVVSSGIASLDAMCGVKGLPSESATVVVGSTGTGKTTLGLHFLSRCSDAEPGLMFSFFESPDRLRAKARGFGLDLEGLESSGALEFLWHPQGEHLLDELGHRLLSEVARRRVRRLVIDGLSGFFEAVTHPERMNRFFSCLVNELRDQGVTVLMMLETRDVVSSTVPTPYGVSGFVDNLLFIRFVEVDGHVKRLLSITKMRDSSFDNRMHAVEIGREGLRVAGVYSSGADVIPSAKEVRQ